MGWFRAALFIGGSAMFVYSAWRLATIRDARLLRLSQMAFYAALMLIVLPKEQNGPGGDVPVWAAFALLLVSFGLTIAHKTRRKPPLPDAGDGPGAP